MALLRDETKLKVHWYLLFAVLGVFHAEVLSWNLPDVLYNPLSFAFTVPVYGVHYVVFGDLLLRSGRRDWKLVYVLGCLTGLYETWITKVYWSPPWNPDPFLVLGVAWFELLWIGFTWHAFMAFLIPFRLLTLFGPRKEDGRLPRLRPLFLAVPGVAAVFALASGRPLDLVVGSLLASFAVILGVALLFRRSARRAALEDWDQLVLGRRGRRIAWGALLAVYLAYGALLRPEALPLGVPLLPVLGLYAFLAVLTVALLRTPAVPDPRVEGPKRPSSPLRNLAAYFGAVLAALAGVVGVLLVAPALVVATAWGIILAGAVLPVFLLGKVVRDVLRAERGGPRGPIPPVAGPGGFSRGRPWP